MYVHVCVSIVSTVSDTHARSLMCVCVCAHVCVRMYVHVCVSIVNTVGDTHARSLSSNSILSACSSSGSLAA